MPRVREGDAVLDPTRPRYETAVEKQIREAQELGAFDDLPGKGKPLPGIDGPDDELWWVKNMIRREGLSTDLLLPPSIQLRKEIDQYHLRQRAKPGITGWAQINQNYDTSIDDVRRKVEYDLAYIERRSVVEEAQSRIVAAIRRLEDAGAITIGRGGEDGAVAQDDVI